MTFTVVIPARHGSRRLHGKPLAEIAGKPMIVHVCERALAASAARVVVATDHDEILGVLPRRVTGLLTAPDHPSGTDRIAAAVAALGLPEEAVVVNLQGDEPLMPATLIEQVAELVLDDAAVDMATLCVPLDDPDGLNDPSVVKVVRNEAGRALWFSRAPFPWRRDAAGAADASVHRRHLGLYAYRVGFLRRFVAWPASPLEQIESLEQLRALEHGAFIRIADARVPAPPGVDTSADLERVRALLRSGAR